MRYLLIALPFLLVFASCKKEADYGIHENGRIEYRITYLNSAEGNFDPALLPKKMTLEFNQDFCTNTIDGFMGMFKLGNVTNFGSKKSNTHLKVLDKSYLYKGDRNEMMCCFDNMEGMQIINDSSSKSIAGLNSQKAKITLPNGENFDIYYTQDIKLYKPNIANPYKSVDGVLTDFILTMGPYKMRFIAQKFDPAKHPKESKRFPKNTQEVSRDEMVLVLNRLMK